MSLKQILSLLVASLFATSLYGQTIVLTEDFSYADGPLAVANPDWVNHSGTADTLLVASGQAVVSQDGGSEDLHRLFDGGAAFSSGVVTADFDIVVSSAMGIADNSDDEYFAHFWQTANPFNFRSRTFVHAPTAGGDYTLSIATQSSSASIDLPTDFTFGDTVPVSISYDITGGTASLTAGGNTVTDLTVNTGQIIDAFGLRQSTNNNGRETILVDNLSVSHTVVPEPSSLMLVLFGLAGLALIRKS